MFCINNFFNLQLLLSVARLRPKFYPSAAVSIVDREILLKSIITFMQMTVIFSHTPLMQFITKHFITLQYKYCYQSLLFHLLLNLSLSFFFPPTHRIALLLRVLPSRLSCVPRLSTVPRWSDLSIVPGLRRIFLHRRCDSWRSHCVRHTSFGGTLGPVWIAILEAAQRKAGSDSQLPSLLDKLVH